MPGRLKVVNLEKDCPLYIYILLAPDVWVIKFLLKYLKLLQCQARSSSPNEYELTEWKGSDRFKRASQNSVHICQYYSVKVDFEGRE